jgi:hypothetical protein
MFNKLQMFYDEGAAGSGAGAAGNNTGGEGGTTQTALTFDAWHSTLPDDQKGLIEEHTKGLKNALDSERGSRKDLEKQLRDMARKAEKGSEAETQLTKMADDLQTADRRADFYESAHAAGVKNLKLAFTVASTDEMFDKRGQVNFDEMKKKYPELFGSTTTPRGDGGSGTHNGNPPDNDMNLRIRRGAGRA